MHNTLLISFLGKLRKTDRPAFVAALVIIFMQLSLTFLKLEVTPFFLYGMYSENIQVTDTFRTLKIFVGGKPLQSYSPPLRERYLLEETAGNFIGMKSNHYTDPLRTRIESTYACIYNSPWYPTISKKIYNDPDHIRQYTAWFRQKCLTAAGVETGPVQIVQTTLVFDTSSLQLKPVIDEVLESL